MYFRKTRLPKKWFDECLKARVSEDPYTDNIANLLKHCWNLNGSTFAISMKHFAGSWGGKSFF